MANKIETRFAILKQKSRPTTWEEVKELKLIARMKEALKTAWVDGSGLAAIQIGVPVRFGLIINGGQEIYLFNPRIISTKPAFVKDWKNKSEGCLSVPGKWSKVPRATKIKYESDGKILKARGMLAHIIQHEIDHMDGVVNVDVAVDTWEARVKPKEQEEQDE